MPDFTIEAAIPGIVCGIDEAGRGPWAGPVVAGAVILDRRRLDPVLTAGLDDSKKLSASRREALFAALKAGARAGTVDLATGIASVEEIDRLNILHERRLSSNSSVQSRSRINSSSESAP